MTRPNNRGDASGSEEVVLRCPHWDLLAGGRPPRHEWKTTHGGAHRVLDLVWPSFMWGVTHHRAPTLGKTLACRNAQYYLPRTVMGISQSWIWAVQASFPQIIQSSNFSYVDLKPSWILKLKRISWSREQAAFLKMRGQIKPADCTSWPPALSKATGVEKRRMGRWEGQPLCPSKCLQADSFKDALTDTLRNHVLAAIWASLSLLRLT